MTMLLAAIVTGRTFFISPTGDDNADGRSIGRAWRTLDRLGRERLGPADRVELASGATFRGGLTITSGGTPKAPVVICSEGAPATVVSPERPAFTIRAGGIELRNLIFKGEAKGERKGHQGVLLWAPGDHRPNFVRIDHLDISGFGAAGIEMTAEKDSPNGFDNVRIAHTRVHGNFGTGIITGDGVSANAKGYAHRNVVISDCDVSENLDGNGIILSGVDGATVEYSRAFHNHSPKGALGMWAWCAKKVTFRYCIAGRTRGKSDAGGFDLDGGTVDSVIEHCLAFDNDGPGYMHCDYPDAPRTERNVFRDSVSIDDGRRDGGQASGFGFVVWGTGLYDCVIERNLAVLTQPCAAHEEGGLLFATFIRTDSIPLSAQKLEGAVFRDNLAEVLVDGAAFVNINFPTRVPGDLSFRGNGYRSNHSAPFIEGAKGEHRFTLSEWKRATGDGLDRSEVWRNPSAIEGYESLQPRDLPKFFQELTR